MAELLICEFCKKTFKTVSAFNVHQKNAKYCLIIQGKMQPVNTVVIFDCKYCEKVLTSKQILNTHQLICEVKIKQDNDKKENELVKLRQENIQLLEYKEQSLKIQEEHKEQIKEHKEQIKELQDKIERMAMKAIEKPTSQTTNNLILSPIDLSQEHISKVIAEKFTKEHFYDGQAGVARFAFDNILKDKDGKLAYICTDVARHIFKHIDQNGEVVKDVRASKLTKKLTADVKKMSGQIVIKKTKEEEEAKVNCSFFLTKKMEEIAAIDQDNSKFRMELANLTVEK